VAGARYRWVCFPFLYVNSPSNLMLNGSVDAQWITAKKDWLEAKKKYKTQYQNPKPTPSFVGSEEKSFENEGMYDKDMDAMRCILYLHGGQASLLFLTYTSVFTSFYPRRLLLW
jgi:hypothetical protein